MRTTRMSVQSASLNRWAARKSDLYPSDPIEQLFVDEAMDTINELLDKPGYDTDPAFKAKQRANFKENVFPRYMRLLSARIKQSGGPFILGAKLSIADLHIYGMLRTIADGYLMPDMRTDVVQDYPLVARLYQEVEAHPIAQNQLKASNKSML